MKNGKSFLLWVNCVNFTDTFIDQRIPKSYILAIKI